MSNAEINITSIGDAYLASTHFDNLFRDAMDLIDNAATYLETDGRVASRDLPQELSFAWATNTMKMTSCLMSCANKLLVYRAVKEGEMTQDEADKKIIKGPVNFRPDKSGEMPDGLQAIMTRVAALTDRINNFERMITR